MRVTISTGNDKLGMIPNVSLPPGVSCAGCEDVCAKNCYAKRPYRRFQVVRRAWDGNLRVALFNLAEYFGQIRERLAEQKMMHFFRWHVGGDILSAEYFQGMIGVAKEFTEKNFLCFTKQYTLVNDYAYEIPANLTIIFSAWPGHSMDNPKGFKVAWMQDGKEDRIPEKHIECLGSCEACGMCWQINKIGMDVVFHKH